MPHPPPTFYPAYTFHLSPTHNSWAKLTAADLHALQECPGFEGQNLYFYLNHPIKWVRLVGVVVAVDVYPGRWIAVLDDGSGRNIEVVCGRFIGGKDGARDSGVALQDIGGGEKAQVGMSATGRSIELTGVDIGSVVKVKGGIGVFRGEKQLLLERLALVHSTTEEAAAWAELSAFKDILSKPWVLGENEQARAKRKAEGLDRHRERKAREEHKKKRLKEKDRPKRPHKEKDRRNGGGERAALQKECNREEAQVNGDPQRWPAKDFMRRVNESTVVKLKAKRPAVSGKFDALGL